METKDTGSSDWPEDEPQTEQKVTLEDYQQLIIQMRRANVQFQQLCNIPSGELTMLLTLRRLLLVKTFVIPSDIGDALKLSRPAVSRMLHNLERKGYLEMKSSEEDHRYDKSTVYPGREEAYYRRTGEVWNALREGQRAYGGKGYESVPLLL